MCRIYIFFCVVVVGGYCIALVCFWLVVKMWVGGGILFSFFYPKPKPKPKP